MNDFVELFTQQKDMLQQLQAQISEMKESKSQVTVVDGLKLDLRKFCAELQQTHKVEMGQEVEGQVRSECKAAKKVRNRVFYSNASDQEKEIAVQCFHAVTDRVKKAWLEKRAAELCEMASKDPSGFWRAFKTQRHNICPVELAAQFEAFRALMGAQPAQTPEQAELSGTSVRAADASCLNAPVTSDELHDCIKRLMRNKSAGIDGILSEMVKDGGEVCTAVF
ncbi:TPA: hypothetical protein ACH3X1_010267 [Trebouxia sp. C0004]